MSGLIGTGSPNRFEGSGSGNLGSENPEWSESGEKLKLSSSASQILRINSGDKLSSSDVLYTGSGSGACWSSSDELSFRFRSVSGGRMGSGGMYAGGTGKGVFESQFEFSRSAKILNEQSSVIRRIFSSNISNGTS